jgi:hypothetical protein
MDKPHLFRKKPLLVLASLALIIASAASVRTALAQNAAAAKSDTVKLAKSASDSAVASPQSQLEKELEAALSATQSSTSASPAQTSPPTRLSSSLNPAISVIGTLLGTAATAEAFEKNIDLGLHEAEFSFQAYVDPYAKADFFVAFGRHGGNPLAAETAGEEGHGAFEPALEEAYLTTLSLPYALKAKAGIFRSAFGKLNLSHPHAHPFADAPRAYANFLGAEGLSDTGVSINWLVPNPFGYFQELTFEFTSGDTESPSFAKATGNKFLYLGHLKNFFDLTENATLEAGLTGVVGPNDSAGHLTKLGGIDLTYKWKPLQRNRYRSFTLMAEALFNRRNEIGGNVVNSKGVYGFANYQIAKRWFLGGRYDYAEFPESGERHDEMFSGVLALYASEFQKLEWQLSRVAPAGEESYVQILLRGVFVIGAHGAHEY